MEAFKHGSMEVLKPEKEQFPQNVDEILERIFCFEISLLKFELF